MWPDGAGVEMLDQAASCLSVPPRAMASMQYSTLSGRPAAVVGALCVRVGESAASVGHMADRESELPVGFPPDFRDEFDVDGAARERLSEVVGELAAHVLAEAGVGHDAEANRPQAVLDDL